MARFSLKTTLMLGNVFVVLWVTTYYGLLYRHSHACHYRVKTTDHCDTPPGMFGRPVSTMYETINAKIQGQQARMN